MLGTIKVGEESIDVKNIERIERKANEKQVTVFTKSNPDTPISGKLSSPIKWSAATRQGDRQVINQTDDFPIRGEVEISTSFGKDLRVPTSDISSITGETQQDMRISQYTTWVSQNKGMYASDASLGIVVSNGMRWVNKIDIDVQTGDERPPGAPKVELKGIEGPMKRQAGDKLLWINGRYAYRANSDANSSNFRGWIRSTRQAASSTKGLWLVHRISVGLLQDHSIGTQIEFQSLWMQN